MDTKENSFDMNLKNLSSSEEHFTDSRFYIGLAEQYIVRDDVESAGYDSELFSDEDMQYLADTVKKRLLLDFREEDLIGDEGTEIVLAVLYDVLHELLKEITDSTDETIILQNDCITLVSFGDTLEEADLNATLFLDAIKSDSFFQDIQTDVKGLDASEIKILDSVIRVQNNKVYVSKEEVEQFLKRFTDKYIQVHCLVYKDELNLKPSKRSKEKLRHNTYTPKIQTEQYDKETVMTPTILGLTSEDYVEGPELSTDIRKEVQALASDFYVFGKYIEGKEVYIKISEGVGDTPFVFSFHQAERPLKYRFK